MTIFEKIINKQIPAKILFENEKYISFFDINPKRPGHFLVVPKKVSSSIIELSNEEFSKLMIQTKEWAEKAIADMGVEGYSIEINSGAKAGQEVFHTHVHVIPANK